MEYNAGKHDSFRFGIKYLLQIRNKSMAVLNILWTGGLDSTYAVVSLVHNTDSSVQIQPFYVIDPNRKSYKKELEAIKQITDKVNSKVRITRILPAKIFKLEEIGIKPDIKTSYDYLSNKYNLGSQYAWMASLADINDLENLIVGLEMSPLSKAYNAITKESKLKTIPLENIEFYKIDKNCNNALSAVMGRFCFMKSLFNMTKTEEVESMNSMEYGDIVRLTWFCHNPVFGLPCGRCNPCKDALNEGMRWRVPLKGRILGTLRIPLNFGIKEIKKVF